VRTGKASFVGERWRALALLSLAEVFAMALWFGASAVVPELREQWRISSGAASWLTSFVQLGFVVGALLSALANLPDRLSARRLIAGSALAAALANAAFALFATGLAVALPLRFLTGFLLAGVYAPGMKLMASWFRGGRGFALGVMVGALTLGSGSPHLINGIGSFRWQTVLGIASGLAVLGAGLVLLVRDGPYGSTAPPLDLGFVVRVFRDRPARLANFGYFGHMWELYAFWAWLPTYLAASIGVSRSTALWSFAAIGGAGFLGSVVGGLAADHFGRTATTIVAMSVSGLCSLAATVVFGAATPVVVGLALVWGFFVIADSAQFSTAVTEICDSRYVGTALTIQTSIGFLLTIGSIRLVPALAGSWGWRWAFAALALGPAFGIWAMSTLRSDPAAIRMAAGAR